MIKCVNDSFVHPRLKGGIAMKRIHLIFIVVSAMILLGALPGCTRGEEPAANYMPTLPADFP